MKRKSFRFAVVFFFIYIILFIPALIRIVEHVSIQSKIRIGIEQYAKEYCKKEVTVTKVYLGWVSFGTLPGGGSGLLWRVDTYPALDTKNHYNHGEYVGKILFFGTDCNPVNLTFVFDDKLKKFIQNPLGMIERYEGPSIILFLISIVFYPGFLIYGLIRWLRMFLNERKANSSINL